MRTPSIVSLLALAVLVVVVDAAAEDACKASSGGEFNVGFDFCVAALSSDPSSGSADDKELAIIAASLGLSNATITKDKIQALLDGKPEALTEECLDTCFDEYSGCIESLNNGLLHLLSGELEKASIALIDAVESPMRCEDFFALRKVPSLLTREDANVKQLSAIALAITNML